MKKGYKIIIILGLLVGAGIIICQSFNVFDSTNHEKKLYIHCNDLNEKYEVYNNQEIHFNNSSDVCKLNLEVRNIERNFIKLNSTLYLYKVDTNMKVIDGSLSNEIYVEPNNKLVLLSMDKKTKFVFEYR